ncbi:hypothetical protein AgCh_026461 [Apium graveolens]
MKRRHVWWGHEIYVYVLESVGEYGADTAALDLETILNSDACFSCLNAYIQGKCGNPKRPPATSQNLEPKFEAEADLIPTPEKQALIRKMRVEKAVKDKVKAVANEQEEKEVQMRAKKRRLTL